MDRKSEGIQIQLAQNPYDVEKIEIFFQFILSNSRALDKNVKASKSISHGSTNSLYTSTRIPRHTEPLKKHTAWNLYILFRQLPTH